MTTRRRRRKRLRRGIYLLPSVFTIGNMLLGFYAVVCGLRGDFGKAALMIFVAVVLDGLDGRIARLTGTDSAFGREYDSLADAVTFGVAPALLAYVWGLSLLGRIGWLVPLFYLVCAVTRLARFNVQTRSADPRYFVGLPVPPAAGLICSLLAFAPRPPAEPGGPPWVLALVVAALLAAGTLMVSTFRYQSFKTVDLRRRLSYRSALPIAAIMLLAAFRPLHFLLAATASYTVSGPLAWLWGWLRSRRSGEAEPAAEPAEETP